MNKMSPESNSGNDMSPWLWLGFPVLILVFLCGVLFHDFELGKRMIARENHVVELGTVIVLIPGIIAGLLSLQLRHRLPNRNIVIWIFLITSACFYFAGEEISWGQQLFKWDTPEKISALNDQNETNLHNMSSWLDQKPRLLIEIWVLVGGIFMPLYFRARNIRHDTSQWKYWFWPDYVTIPSAILAIIVKVPERLRDFFDYNLFEKHVRYSELQELYIALFLTLYLYSVYVRLGKSRL